MLFNVKNNGTKLSKYIVNGVTFHKAFLVLGPF